MTSEKQAALALQVNPTSATRRSSTTDVAPAFPTRLHAAVVRRIHGLIELLKFGHAKPDRTCGKHELSELTIDSPNVAAGVHFVSTPWAVLSWVHRALPPDEQKRRATFIDLGAGKGRAVLSAAAKPYKRVVGVEFAAELAAAARSNIRDLGLDPWRVSIIEGDAADYAFPNGPLIVFMFNPFGPSVLTRVLDKLEARAAEGRGSVVLAYLNPVHRDLVDKHPGFAVVPLEWRARVLFGTLSPYRLALYETRAQPTDLAINPAAR